MSFNRRPLSMIIAGIGLALGAFGHQAEAMVRAEQAAKAYRAQWRFGVAMRTGSLRPAHRSRYAKPGPNGTRKQCRHKKTARAARRARRMRG